MKKSMGMNVFGAIICQLLVLANFIHGFFTWGICAEQIKTGWGLGTNWEMGVLLPWMVEFLSAPVILAAIIFLILSIWKKCEKVIFVLSGVFLFIEVLQILIFNLFVFY